MQKGVEASRTSRSSKWGAELGIGISWNILCGFPGETRGRLRARWRGSSRRSTTSAVARLRADHRRPLQPAVQPAPPRFGIRIQPVRSYRYVYPFADQEDPGARLLVLPGTGPLDGRARWRRRITPRSAFQATRSGGGSTARVLFDYDYADPDHIVVRDTRGVSVAEERTLSTSWRRAFSSSSISADVPRGLMKRLGEGIGSAPRGDRSGGDRRELPRCQLHRRGGGQDARPRPRRTGAVPLERDRSFCAPASS